MSASLSDKITDTFNATNPNVAKVTSSRAGAVTTLTCDSLAGWPTASKVHFSTYQVDVSGNYVDGTQIDWEGIVSSSTTIGSLTRVAGASDSGNSIGDYVEMNPTAKWGQDLADGFTLEHSRAGVHALTSNSTLTSSKFITALDDTNGNELIKLSPTTSAVNEVTLANAATGGRPVISASGDDTNISLELRGKGTGGVLVTNPHKFSAYASGTTSLAAGSYTKIAFATEEYDSGNNFASSTFTAPVSGFYKFSAAFQATAGAANELYQIALYKNGSIFKKGNGISSAASGTMNLTISPPPIQLAANDTVEVYGFQNSGGSKTVSSGQADTYFGGYLISL